MPMNINFTKEEVFNAYKKLKHYFYYDNTSLYIRQRLAEFENSIESNEDNFNEVLWAKMEQIANKINSGEIKETLEGAIDFRVTPKSFKKSKTTILTNRSSNDSLRVERLNFFIDASIEVHLISVLWLSYVGQYLNKWIDQDNYAYQLELFEDEDEKQGIVNGLRLYKPYYIQYQNWRDKAIKRAEELLKDKKDAVVLSLDIKDYFHSVNIDLSELKEQVLTEVKLKKNYNKIEKLFFLLSEIHRVYTDKIKDYKQLPENSKSILPIGLLSSGILGNFYLVEFDKHVKANLNPSFYGRYVDDILLVLTNVNVENNAIYPINNFLNEYFVKRGIFEFYGENKDSKFFEIENGKSVFKDVPLIEIDQEGAEYYAYLIEAQNIKFQFKDLPDLIIQSSKVLLQDFHHNDTPALISKFKKNLEKNRSEFRYLPDEEKVDEEFEESAFSLHYNDSINKLRSIKDFSEDKYGASKYLAGKIFASSLSGNEPIDKNTNKQILTFFKDEIGVSFHTLWEKVATYFIVTNQPSLLYQFFNQTKISILNINFSEYEDANKIEVLEKKLLIDLFDYLSIAISVPLAYNPLFKLDKIEELKKKTLTSLTRRKDFVSLKEMAKQVRGANLFRHAWLNIPAINFTDFLFSNESENNLLKVDSSLFEKSATKLSINNRLSILSPRYVHFHDLNILEIYNTIYSIEDVDETTLMKFNEISEKAFDKYWRINNLWKYPDEKDEKLKCYIQQSNAKYFNIEPQKSGSDNSATSVRTEIVEFPSTERAVSDKKVALANIKVHESNISRSYLGKPNTSRKRRQELFDLINMVEKEKCDMFVLPEVSVPYHWINLLAYQSQRRNLGIVAGLEHWVNNSNYAFNFMVTILPIEKQGYKTCLITLRLKNHYSHGEKKVLKGYRLLVPGEHGNKTSKIYNLFKWRNSYFSVYNCFELCDINDRALFKSKVDFLIASEYNRDTQYFSEIAGTWVRDLHCFFIQVNSSDYGDSRIIQPSSSITKDILQIKGGANSTILVGNLSINRLRQFQRMDYYLQKDDGTFKPTPPDFDYEEVIKRINNK